MGEAAAPRARAMWGVPASGNLTLGNLLRDLEWGGEFTLVRGTSWSWQGGDGLWAPTKDPANTGALGVSPKVPSPIILTLGLRSQPLRQI